MKKSLLLFATSLSLSMAGHAAEFAISFDDSDFNDTAGASGLFWNGYGGNAPSDSNLTATDGTTATGISFSTITGGGFDHPSNGSNVSITENGITFPGEVNDGFLATNLDGRNGLMVFRFTAPNAAEFQNWEFTITSSYSRFNNEPEGRHLAKFNIGGTYSSVSKDFTGGTTITLDGSLGSDRIDAGVLSSIANFDGSNYYIDLQVGFAGAEPGDVAAINALHVTTVPEPAAAALLFGAAGLMFVLRRRRR